MSFIAQRMSLIDASGIRKIFALAANMKDPINLSIGLPAELDARRKQYAHYRDRLLTFKEAAA